MIEQKNSYIKNPKYSDICVEGYTLKQLLEYVRIDKETGEEIPYKDSEGKSFYMVQRVQLLSDDIQDKLMTELFGENITAEELVKEYLNYSNDDEDTEEYC